MKLLSRMLGAVGFAAAASVAGSGALAQQNTTSYGAQVGVNASF